MELTTAQIDSIKQMAGRGQSIGKISKELKLDYWLVWKYAERSWQGTKTVITRRLNLLVKEQNQSAREEMVSEVRECVDYLYYQGKHLGDQVGRARKALDD